MQWAKCWPRQIWIAKTWLSSFFISNPLIPKRLLQYFYFPFLPFGSLSCSYPSASTLPGRWQSNHSADTNQPPLRRIFTLPYWRIDLHLWLSASALWVSELIWVLWVLVENGVVDENANFRLHIKKEREEKWLKRLRKWNWHGKKMKIKLTWANENENCPRHQFISHVYFKLMKTNSRANGAQS